MIKIFTVAKFAAVGFAVAAATAGTFYLGCQGIKHMYQDHLEKHTIEIVKAKKR